MENQKKSKFGVTKETKAVNSAPLLVATKLETPDPQYPSGYKFPIAYLVNVVFNPALEKKDGGTVIVLQFIFKDTDNRQYTHVEWEVEDTDAKFDEKLEGMNSRIKHIYTAIFSSFPEEGIGATAQNFAEFFEEVAKVFNSQVTGEAGDLKKVYASVPLYYKLVYYKTRLGFPLSPNFLEKVVTGRPCKLLAINPTYDKLEPQGARKGGGIPGLGTVGTSGELPSSLPKFEEEYE